MTDVSVILISLKVLSDWERLSLHVASYKIVIICHYRHYSICKDPHCLLIALSTYDVLYLIFLLLLPVSRTSPTSRTSFDRPVFSRASCSSTVRNLQTGTGKQKNKGYFKKRADRELSRYSDIKHRRCSLTSSHLRICSAAVRPLSLQHQQRTKIKAAITVLLSPFVVKVVLRTDVLTFTTAATSATLIARFSCACALFHPFRQADFRRMDSSKVTESIQETPNSSENVS